MSKGKRREMTNSERKFVLLPFCSVWTSSRLSGEGGSSLFSVVKILISSRNTLTYTSRNNVLLSYLGIPSSPVTWTHKINCHNSPIGCPHSL